MNLLLLYRRQIRSFPLATLRSCPAANAKNKSNSTVADAGAAGGAAELAAAQSHDSNNNDIPSGVSRSIDLSTGEIPLQYPESHPDTWSRSDCAPRLSNNPSNETASAPALSAAMPAVIATAHAATAAARALPTSPVDVTASAETSLSTVVAEFPVTATAPLAPTADASSCRTVGATVVEYPAAECIGTTGEFCRCYKAYDMTARGHKHDNKEAASSTAKGESEAVRHTNVEDVLAQKSGACQKDITDMVIVEAALDASASRHCLRVLRVEEGSSVQIGVFNGGICQGRICAFDRTDNILRVHLQRDIRLEAPPSPPSLIDLLVAIPRPKTLDKILQLCATFGVGRLLLVCSARVERSYLESPKLSVENIRRQLKTGLEQAVATRLPEVHVFASWRALMVFLRPVHDPCELHAKCINSSNDSRSNRSKLASSNSGIHKSCSSSACNNISCYCIASTPSEIIDDGKCVSIAKASDKTSSNRSNSNDTEHSGSSHDRIRNNRKSMDTRSGNISKSRYSAGSFVKKEVGCVFEAAPFAACTMTVPQEESQLRQQFQKQQNFETQQRQRPLQTQSSCRSALGCEAEPLRKQGDLSAAENERSSSCDAVADAISDWCCYTSSVGRSRRLLAHPSSSQSLPSLQLQKQSKGRVLIAIGPEGGWLPQEVEELQRQQLFTSFALGDKVLRCETALVSVISQVNMLLFDPTLRQKLPPPSIFADEQLPSCVCRERDYVQRQQNASNCATGSVKNVSDFASPCSMRLRMRHDDDALVVTADKRPSAVVCHVLKSDTGERINTAHIRAETLSTASNTIILAKDGPLTTPPINDCAIAATGAAAVEGVCAADTAVGGRHYAASDDFTSGCLEDDSKSAEIVSQGHYTKNPSHVRQRHLQGVRDVYTDEDGFYIVLPKRYTQKKASDHAVS